MSAQSSAWRFSSPGNTDMAVVRTILGSTIWLWLKKVVPTWHPGKWNHVEPKTKTRVTQLFNFEPYPFWGR